MTVPEAFFHLVNFCLPAIFVGGALALWGRRYNKRRTLGTWFINSFAGIATLALGLMMFDVDGGMMSYALLVLVISCTQLLVGWRK